MASGSGFLLGRSSGSLGFRKGFSALQARIVITAYLGANDGGLAFASVLRHTFSLSAGTRLGTQYGLHTVTHGIAIRNGQ